MRLIDTRSIVLIGDHALIVTTQMKLGVKCMNTVHDKQGE